MVLLFMSADNIMPINEVQTFEHMLTNFYNMVYARVQWRDYA